MHLEIAMTSKRPLAALMATAAITSFVALPSTAATTGCLLGKSKGLLGASAETSPSGLTIHQPTSPNKMGIIGAGAVAIAGLFAGGMALKARLSKPATAAEPESLEQSPSAEEFFQTATFPIPVPTDAVVEDAAEAVSTVR